MANDQKVKNEKAAKGCLSVFGLIFVVVLVAALFDDLSHPHPTPAKPGATTPTYWRNKFAAPKGGTDVLAIWRDYDAMQKGTSLLAARQAADLIEPLIACYIHTGDPVTITGGGMFSQQVMVTDGPSRGCEGWTELELLADNPPAKP